MTSLMSFLFFFLLPPNLAVLTPVIRVVESLGSLESLLFLCCFFFLFFLALLEDSKSWVEVDIEALKALESSPQFTAPCVWTL